LGIYLLCNLVTALILVGVFSIYLPKFDDEHILRRSRIDMEESFAKAEFNKRYRVECVIDTASRKGWRDVDCTVLDGSEAIAWTTYFYTDHDGPVGHESVEAARRND
jgi:hypothetical protein